MLARLKTHSYANLSVLNSHFIHTHHTFQWLLIKWKCKTPLFRCLTANHWIGWCMPWALDFASGNFFQPTAGWHQLLGNSLSFMDYNYEHQVGDIWEWSEWSLPNFQQISTTRSFTLQHTAHSSHRSARCKGPSVPRRAAGAMRMSNLVQIWSLRLSG